MLKKKANATIAAVIEDVFELSFEPIHFDTEEKHGVKTSKDLMVELEMIDPNTFELLDGRKDTDDLTRLRCVDGYLWYVGDLYKDKFIYIKEKGSTEISLVEEFDDETISDLEEGIK